jgi:DNA-binding CsgD family transcriptional regulator
VTAVAAPQRRLTRREGQVLQEIARGLTAAQIARRLHLSQRTVHTHKYNAYRKLGASNGSEAVTLAVRFGVLRIKGVALHPCPLCGCDGAHPDPETA